MKSSSSSVESTSERCFPIILKSLARVLLRQKATGVCRVYCMDQKFVPRKLKIEVKSHVFGVASRYKELITFRFDTKLNTYKEKKMDWIERERQRNSPGPQRWTSAPASMLLNKFNKHKGDLWMRVTVTWRDQWGDGPSCSLVPMLWFSEQVREDVVNTKEFVFRIWTQGGISSQHEGCTGLVMMKM